MSARPSRRAVLKGALVLAALPVAGFTADRRLSPIRTDRFTLGMASGEPSTDGAVIWTRLAPNPLADDGFGGMPARGVDVEWEVARDEWFTRFEQRGVTTAVPQAGHSVHVELAGLRPGADYFYRFRTGGYEMCADFRVVPYVSRPGAGVRTGASFVVPDRAPALHAM